MNAKKQQISNKVKSPTITAVIVSYEPDVDLLLENIEAITTQVSQLVIVDNASTDQDSIGSEVSKKCPSVVFKALSENSGLGFAHNQGIAIARENESDYVLLLDQDSTPTAGMVEQLVSDIQLRSQVVATPTSAIGPRYVGADRSDSFFIQFGLAKFKRIYQDSSNSNVTPCDFLISSGALISLDALNDIGDMDQDLFIDHVDTEWFLRAKSKGYQAYGSFSSVMQHSLGEQTHKFRLFGFGRERNVPEHKPFRYYYMFRNSVALYKRSYVSKLWIWNDLQRLAQIFIFYGLCVGDRKANIKMMCLGIKHGMSGNLGKQVF